MSVFHTSGFVSQFRRLRSLHYEKRTGYLCGLLCMLSLSHPVSSDVSSLKIGGYPANFHKRLQAQQPQSSTRQLMLLGNPAATKVQQADLQEPNAENNVVPLQSPVGIAPASEAVLPTAATIHFIWLPVTGADLYDFRILNAASETVVRVGEFSAHTICASDRCRLTQELGLEAAKGYIWQVRAHNRAGWSAWSNSGFDILPLHLSKPKMPLSLYPGADSTLHKNQTITFVWEHQSAVESYRFQLLNRATKEVLVDTTTKSRTFCNNAQCAYSRPINLPMADTYAWQIQAVNAAGESGWYRTPFAVIDRNQRQSPLAAFEYSVYDADPLSVSFALSGTAGDRPWVSYIWSFGDGNKVRRNNDGQNIAHQYRRSGSYLVGLTVTDDLGAAYSSQQWIHIGSGAAPRARFSIEGFVADASGSAPFIATFDPSASTDDRLIVNFAWDFGDQSDIVNLADAAVVSHSYTAEGLYTVTLTVTDDSHFKSVFTRQVSVQDSTEAVSLTQAGRFIAQATFGASDDEISTLMETGFEAWLDEQFSLKGAPHLDYVRQFQPEHSGAARHEIWWQDVILGRDQLRQRVAFAFSQIFALSDSNPALANKQYGLTAYYDLLREHAFANYRDLLEAVVLNPVMALHSGVLHNRSDRENPARVDLGFARTLLQRFSLGGYLLNADGAVTTTPAYTEKDVENIARALTGWYLRGADDWEESVQQSSDQQLLGEPQRQLAWVSPMVASQEHHDVKSKVLPGVLLGAELAPPALTAEQDLALVLDSLFAHPNLGPFLGKQLIQKLVTSNPSPAYIKRVAAVFDDNGVGVRGDLQSVIRAVLLDSEARQHPVPANFGKLREPVLRLAHLWRAFGVRAGTASERGELVASGINLQDLNLLIGQAVLGATTVERALSPLNTPPGPLTRAGMQSPGFGHFSVDYLLSTTGFINKQIFQHHSNASHAEQLQSAYLDFSHEYVLAADPIALLKWLDRLLLAGTMSNSLYDVLLDHLSGLPGSVAGRSTRVHDAIALIIASPDYLVQM